MEYKLAKILNSHFFISSILGYKLIIMSKETKTEETNENVKNLLDEVSSLNANVAPEEFDWESFESGLNEKDRKEKEELEKMYDDTLEDLNENEVIKGKVVRITDKEAIVDINFKSEGVISLNEFRYNPNLSVGDEVEVMVDVREDKNGQLVLSHRKARTLNAWDAVNKAHDEQEIVNGYIKARTKGGMIVDVFGIDRKSVV